MLSARYVYLHEALDLGVMWLNQAAKVVRPNNDSESTPLAKETASEHKTRAAQHPASCAAVHTPNTSTAAGAGQMARQELLRRFVRQAPNNKLPEKVEQQKSDDTVQNHLSGSLNHTVQLLVLSVSASPADVLAGRLFSGEDGVLLNKMLSAIGLSEQDVHCATWLGDELLFEPRPEWSRVQAALPYLQNLYQSAGQPILLLLGHFFEQEEVIDLVKQIDENVRYFTIAHPQRILNDDRLKRPAWTTLQQIQKLLTHG